jgi:PPOX class probable FMN-dependent enzyme
VQPVTVTTYINNEEELRTIIGKAGGAAIRKDIGRIDPHAAAFIRRSPFCLVATSNASGQCDVSPRGDPPGSVLVLDEHTLALAERPGNRRADTGTNILDNPHVGLLFLVPGSDDTLRVNGRARLTADPSLLDRLAMGEKRPQFAIVVEVEELYLHCVKAFRRSNLWDPEAYIQPGELASAGQVYKDQMCLTDIDASVIDADLEKDAKERLY